jgi:hypothetical protein
MKVITGCAVLLMAAVASANLLTNPGFEADNSLTGWNQTDWYVGTGADAHSGSNGAAYWVPADRLSGEYYVAAQSVSVTSGLTYNASMWLRTVSFNASESFMEVVFQDGAGSWIGQTNTIPVTGVTAYNQYLLNGLVAPAGAVTAMVRAVVHTTGATTDNAWHTFDDFNFDAVIPEPGTLTLCLTGIGFGSILMHRRRKNG